jgi:hypothetical protein
MTGPLPPIVTLKRSDLRFHRHHPPVLNYAIGHRSSAQCATNSRLQLSATLREPLPTNSLPRQIPIDNQALTAVPRTSTSREQSVDEHMQR